VTGPLDTFSVTNANHPKFLFGFNNKEKKQVAWYYPDASLAANSDAVVLDYYLGEPFPGEQIESYERRMRLLHWDIKEPSNNSWFVDVYERAGATIGVLADGKTYTLDNGLNDFDTIAINELLQAPHFAAGNSSQRKNMRRIGLAFKPKGIWNVLVRKYVDRDTAPTGTEKSLAQAPAGSSVYDVAVYNVAEYASSGLLIHEFWAEEYAFEFSIDLRNQQADEDWVLAYFDYQYQWAD
jgi:hypothetical protein